MAKKGITKKEREEIMNRISSTEFKDQIRIENQNWYNSLTLDYQLGYFVGLQILQNRLPSLPINIYTSKKSNVNITEEEKLKYEKLEIEFEKDDENEEKYDKLNEFNLELEKKYLPNPYLCKFDLVRFEDETEFRRGLIVGLTHPEIEYYSIENIEINIDLDYRQTIFKFNAFWAMD
jgi:hypothetical protein